MSVVTAPLPVRPEPNRDRFGRYQVPDPVTGKEVAWTRATTWAKSIADTFGLTKWKLRMATLGVSQREDLLLGVSSLADPVLVDDNKDAKQKLDKICEAAMEHAGASTAANRGTALHEYSHQLDLGRKPKVMAPYDADLRAYQGALEAYQITVSPRYVERVVLLPEMKVAGTMDRLVRWQGDLYVGDLKSGKDLDYSWLEISIQLALYAHADWLWDTETLRHFKMPAGVNRERALVFHLPVGQATCTPYWVDIASGWAAAELCGLVRAWRNRKDLAARLT